MMIQPKAVVVRVMKGNTPVHRSIYKFQDEGLIKKFMKNVKVIYPTAETYIIDIRNASEPDPKVTKVNGQLWCPYCSSYRYYALDMHIGTSRCEICGISTNDFYVKAYNQLWPRFSQSDLNKKKKERR